MRVSSFSNVPFIPPIAPQAAPPQTPCAPPAPAAFLPLSLIHISEPTRP